MNDDARWMGAALGVAARARGTTSPNPAVGCVIVADGRVVGRGWTQPGGRPHAEALALAQAGDAAHGATCYVTLEPCAHVSPRGPACADLLAESGVARVVMAAIDPDPRTAGKGAARLAGAGITVVRGVRAAEAQAQNPGFFSRHTRDRPFVTLKLALSLDGCIAMADGSSRWITGPQARAHAHRERALADMIVVGRGTFEADDPALDVRLPGLEAFAPVPVVLSRSLAALPADARIGPRALLLPGMHAIDAMPHISNVLVEGGATLAAALLAADRVDRLLVYRAPLLLGGKPGVSAMDLTDLAAAHGRWTLAGVTDLAPDRLEDYRRTR
jgi:diaminohydroxyphosphoribosylaminopyrimidine deaminase / 5-amino-6-(5-phosphoribosylamino)uracil reductase